MTKTIDPASISTQEMHGYLLAAVAPRPIAFASTVDKDGAVNLSPFSFFNVFSANPPIMVFSPARRGTNNTTKHTFENLLEVPETVISVVNHPMVEQMSLASTEYPRGTNEFVKAGFTQVASEKVKPPRVGESPVSFECVVDNIIELGDEGGAGNLIVSRVVMIHLNDAYLDEAGKLDTEKLDMVGRMGGSWYCRASGEALFEIPKPLRTQGIGVDQLPDAVRNSAVLTGNNLGRLGNLEQLPSSEEIKAMREVPAVANIFDAYHSNQDSRAENIHRYAQDLILAGDAESALKTLLLLEDAGS
ncbi:MAG: flavin reductase family protein [Rhodothermales bacterium]